MDENFDWSNESKERYFAEAEKRIADAGFANLIKVDRDSFGIVGGNKVKIYLKPFQRKGNARKWFAVKNLIPELVELKPQKNAFGTREKLFAIHGCMMLELKEEVE